MNTARKLGTTSLALIAFFFISNTLMAQRADTSRVRQGHKGMHARGEHGTMGIPNLTDDQKAKIKAQQVSFGKEALPMKNQLAEKRAHLRTLQTAQNYDANAVNATIDDITKAESQLMKKSAANHEAIRKLLTDEQRLAFDSQKGFRGGHGKSHNKHRRGHWN